jgi:hypothetical protein
MYCPRCGRQPIADELRFCSYCGFKLGLVKASLADSEEATVLVAARTLAPQRDINLGVILIFFVSLFAMLLARRFGPGGREVGALILALFYLATLVFSRPITKAIHKLLSWDQSDANLSLSARGVSVGGTLMLVTEVVLAISSLLLLGRMRTPEFYLGLASSFALLLIIGPYILRALRHLLVPDSTVFVPQLPENDRNAVSPVFASPALGTGQGVPISILASDRVNTSEIISPPSITEHTTNLLDNKKDKID